MNGGKTSARCNRLHRDSGSTPPVQELPFNCSDNVTVTVTNGLVNVWEYPTAVQALAALQEIAVSLADCCAASRRMFPSWLRPVEVRGHSTCSYPIHGSAE